MDNLNKNEAAQEGSVQEQPQLTRTISIKNLDKFNALVSEITEKLNELKNFKLEIKIEK